MLPLPHNVEAEQYLLSTCLRESTQGMAAAINAGVTPASFFDTAHATIFSGLQALVAERIPPEAPNLIAHLNTAKSLNAAGGPEAVWRIAQLLPTTIGRAGFIRQVRELQTLRALIRTTTALAAEAAQTTEEIPEFLERAQRSILELARDRVKPARLWPQAVAEVDARLDQLLTAVPGEIMPGEISWSLDHLDRDIGPLGPGQLVVLAARPSVGKSSLMRQVAYGAMAAGKHVYIASLEVKDRDIARNLAQFTSGVSYRSLRRAAKPAELEKFREALHALRGIPLHVDDDFSGTVAQICARARMLKAQHGLALVCVDHLHELMECKRTTKGMNLTDMIGVAVKAFKELAGELELPVLLLAQLNRGPEQDGRAPSLADLRASGDIEQAADKVVLLHRPAKDPRTDKPQATDTSDPIAHPYFYTDAIQAKGRDDGTNRCLLIFERACARFQQVGGKKAP